MAEALAETKDLSICTICLGSYKTPRILPCLHSFCELCISPISEYIISTVTQPGQNTFNCPVCRFVVTAIEPEADKSKWVSDLPLKPHPEYSTAFSETENKQQLCHPCERAANKIEACIWCCECNEALCQSCQEFHSRLKMTSTHKTVSIDTLEGVCGENLSLMKASNDFCSIHKDKRIEKFCTDHNELVCINCVLENHRKCGHIQDINNIDDQLAGNTKRLESDINKIQTIVKSLSEEKTEKKCSVQSTITSVETEALGIVTQLKMKLDDLNIEFLKKTGLQQDALQSELDQDLKELGKFDSALDKLMHNMKDISLLGSKVQVFLTTRRVYSEFSEVIQNLKSLLMREEFCVEAKFDNLLKSFENIKDLGNLTVSRSKQDNEDVNSLILKIEEPEFASICLKFHSSLQFVDDVRSCVHLDDNSCVMLFAKKLALVNTTQNKIIDSVTMTEYPRRLCYDSDDKTVYGTCGKSCFSCKVQDGKIENYQSFKIDKGTIHGLDACNGNIFLVTKSNVLLRSVNSLEKRETFIKTVYSDENIDVAIDRHSKRLAVLRQGEKSIYFGSIQERSLYEGNESSKIYLSQSIAFGPSGLLFVTTSRGFFSTPTIYVISKNEKNRKTLLEALNNINDVTVSCDNSKLYVSGGKGVEIYDIVYS